MEIERKFLVKNSEYKQLTLPIKIAQGYLCTEKDRTVRVRINGDRGFITIKSGTIGISRQEYEYEIPPPDAMEMLQNLCLKPIIEKQRYAIEHDSNIWEVDEFSGENSGLVVAEIELTSEDQEFSKPSWIGDEVSDDARYFNSNLIKHPYKLWGLK